MGMGFPRQQVKACLTRSKITNVSRFAGTRCTPGCQLRRGRRRRLSLLWRRSACCTGELVCDRALSGSYGKCGFQPVAAPPQPRRAEFAPGVLEAAGGQQGAEQGAGRPISVA